MKWSDKLILVDCDGVLLDWTYGFDRWALMKHDKVPINYDIFGIHNRYGIIESTADNLVEQFNQSAHIGYLPAFRDSIRYVQTLHRDYGFVFHCITSMGKDIYANELRRKNLEALFGKFVFEDIQFLDLFEDKSTVLEKYVNTGCMWIEDNPNNAVAGVELGLKSILMTDNYNKEFDHPGVTKVNTWKEIYDMVVNK